MASGTSSSAAVVGGTGLVGRNILSTLLSSSPPFSPIHAISRRALTLPPSLLTSPNLITHIEPSTTLWPPVLTTSTPKILFSALGTTRAQAGSVAAQREIDYDLNLLLARTAKEAGTSTYVLISTAGAKANAYVPYSKMKGELEDAVKGLGFRYTVILRPGLIVGEREDTRVVEGVVRRLAGWAGMLGNGAKDFWAQDAEVIARAAVRAGVECVEGKREEGVWVLEQGDIVRLGKKD